MPGPADFAEGPCVAWVEGKLLAKLLVGQKRSWTQAAEWRIRIEAGHYGVVSIRGACNEQVFAAPLRWWLVSLNDSSHDRVIQRPGRRF
jgi:hypothetical protein